MNKTFLAILLLAVLPAHAFARPAEPSYCVVVSNSLYPNLRTISVEVDGYDGYWVIEPNQTKALLKGAYNDPEEDVRGASLTLSIYEGRQGHAGRLLDSTTIAGDGNVYSSHTLATPVPPANANANVALECQESGYWNVQVHD